MLKPEKRNDFIKALYKIPMGDCVKYLDNIYVKVPGGWLAKPDNVNIAYTFIPYVSKIDLSYE